MTQTFLPSHFSGDSRDQGYHFQLFLSILAYHQFLSFTFMLLNHCTINLLFLSDTNRRCAILPRMSAKAYGSIQR